jgi:DNA-binding transcriptional regulator GbsR (MarR family)
MTKSPEKKREKECLMQLMTIPEITRKTGRSQHLVRMVIKKLNMLPVRTEPVGRYHRQFFESAAILEHMKTLKPTHRNGAQSRHLKY